MITPILYEEISPDVCTNEKASEYYFYQNALGLSDTLDEEFEQYEAEQIKMRNKVIANAFHTENFHTVPDLNSTIFGVSAIKNKVILITEMK